MFKRVLPASIAGLFVCVALSTAGCGGSDESLIVGQDTHASKIYGAGLDCPNEPWPVCESGVHDFCHFWDGTSDDGDPPDYWRTICAYILCAEGSLPLHDCPGFDPPEPPGGGGGGGGGGGAGGPVADWDPRRELRAGECSTLVGPRRCCPQDPWPESYLEWAAMILGGRGENCWIQGNGNSSKLIESQLKIAGIEPIGKALSRRVLVKLARNAAARGTVSKIEGAQNIVTKVVNLTHKGAVDPKDVLGAASKYLGKGAVEVRPGTFDSILYPHRFRMVDKDLIGAHGNIGKHVHFIRLDRVGGAPIENLHVPILP